MRYEDKRGGLELFPYIVNKRVEIIGRRGLEKEEKSK